MRELCGEALRGEDGQSRKKGEKKKVEGRGRRKSRTEGRRKTPNVNLI